MTTSRSDPVPLRAAVAYAERFGWAIFPVGEHKRPLCPHGRNDASRDPDAIRQLWQPCPGALAALATGVESGIVAIDVDIRKAVDGRDSLEEIGVALHPETPTAHSPSGGFHLLFRHPGGRIKTIAGKLGPGLDIRGDGGSITLPPGPGRFWDPVLHPLKVPLAPFPAWARVPEPPAPELPRQPIRQGLSRYGEVALDAATAAISQAGAGAQEVSLNRAAFGIGQLVGGGVIPAALAQDALVLAARSMPAFDHRRPWRAREIELKVQAALLAGMREPRRPQHAGR